MTIGSVSAETVLAELRRVAEIAAGILDGDEVKQIVNEQAMHFIANPDPKFIFLSGDYFDVDQQLFLRTKKLLLRLERLGKVTMNSALWVPVPGQDAVTLVLHNGAYHRYYTFGLERLATPSEMKEVLEAGTIVSVPPSDDKNLATVLAPVRDSLGDVVGVVEMTAPLNAPPPAWS
jgi:hypothetical protein